MRSRSSTRCHGISRRIVLAFLGSLILICVGRALSQTANVKEIRRVLVIYEAGLSYSGVASVDRAIREALNKSPYQIELYTENLEEILFSEIGRAHV